MIGVRVDLPNEDTIFIDIVNTGPVRGWPEGDGIYSTRGAAEPPPIPDLFHYKVRSEGGTRYFTHNRTHGWKQCVVEALRVMA